VQAAVLLAVSKVKLKVTKGQAVKAHKESRDITVLVLLTVHHMLRLLRMSK
jgi:hypothetical protein